MDTVIAWARAETEPDGSLLVTWDLGGDPVAVDIALGPSPDHICHEHHQTVQAGRTTLRVHPPKGGRLFVSVAPHGGGPAVVTADRRVAFRGITNFRDLGGYRTRLGVALRWGSVFRADALHGLEPDDLRLYEQLSIRTIYDLRGDLERSERPNRMHSVHIPVISRPAGASTPELAASVSIADGERLLAQMYKGVIDHSAEQIGRIFAGLTEAGSLPAVFHCHAGKDRTGVVAAVLLETLGVDRQDILDDYELTARYRLRSQQDATYDRLIQAGLSAEAAAGVLTTPRWAMDEALGYLDCEYSGVEEYLTGPAGLCKEDLEVLRDVLLEQR